ncbi:hypothetical protein ACIQY5_19205 [Peribacillus frigoritolerans]|uniref:hypothetical protein n=1 Tax=Peribacillus frigoritolerans TaxID=450367 RepID=UPI0037F83A8F
MKLIEGMIEELKDISTGWNKGLLSTEERDLKISLIIDQVKGIQINFLPLEAATEDTRGVFKQLLTSRKYVAIESLTTLKEAGNNKRKYNSMARDVITKKLYFLPLALTIERTVKGYSIRNDSLFHVKEFQKFIYDEREGAKE